MDLEKLFGGDDDLMASLVSRAMVMTAMRNPAIRKSVIDSFQAKLTAATEAYAIDQSEENLKVLAETSTALCAAYDIIKDIKEMEADLAARAASRKNDFRNN